MNYEEAYMRMCPAMFNIDHDDKYDQYAFGLVTFHELMHIISATTDAEGGYTKAGANKLA